MAANARQSPLLRVSPEIRNKIYKLVLGGYAVHVFPGPVSGNIHRICTSPHVDEETSDNNSGDSRHSWLDTDPHKDCRRSWDLRGGERHDKLDLRLLQACKQIHEEAALLPFASNTFLLETVPQLAWFSECLLSAQRSAVASVVLNRADLSLSPYRVSQADKARLRRLTGLKKLRVNVGTYWPIHELHPSLKDLTSHLAHWLEVLPLRSMDGATVRVRAPRTVLQEKEEKEGLTQSVPKAYADWCLEAEKALLQKPDK